MLNPFGDGGVYFSLLWLLAIVVVVLSVTKAVVLFGKRELTERLRERGVNAILFWGSISAVVGFLSALIGMHYAAGLVEGAKAAPSVTIVWGGIRASLTLIIFGLVIFTFSAIAWFVLRWRYSNLQHKPN